MPRPRPLPLLAAAIAALPLLPVHAQRAAPGSTLWSASASAYAEFDAGLDRGGSTDVTALLASGDVLHQWTPSLAAGVSLRYGYQRWSFDGDLPAFGTAPWDDVHRPSVAFPLTVLALPDVTLAFVPTLAWSYEQGAGTGDSLVAGALVSATRRFADDLRLGLGVGVFDDLEKTRAFPFVVVDWRIDDRWRVGNPFRAGPAGGAGLEIAYAASDAWEVGVGGTWRSERFRLDDDGPAPGGIGEARAVPLFVRATWQASRDVRLDVTAGAALGGKLTLMDPQGRDLVEEDVDPAPFLGITLRTRF